MRVNAAGRGTPLGVAREGLRLKVVRTREELARALMELRRTGELALVPTMGYLHDGHLSLVDLAREEARRVAVSIFVNPLQFGPAEDFGRYPRDEARDLGLLEARGTDLVFVPAVEEMYPGGEPIVTVHSGTLGRRLCGAFRAGHFDGVLTVVAKLFGLFRPDAAVFGRKDYQQSVLIRRMVRDLELGPLRIHVGPTLREADGLAMSSRNAYLSAEERAQAVGLNATLVAARDAFAAGERSGSAILDSMMARLGDFPLLGVQYVELVDPETLERVEEVDGSTVAALAAFAGRTRLIDNATLS
jgi:pantoate--beta-alanine ligase